MSLKGRERIQQGLTGCVWEPGPISGLVSIRSAFCETTLPLETEWQRAYRSVASSLPPNCSCPDMLLRLPVTWTKKTRKEKIRGTTNILLGEESLESQALPETS